jgi:hypothetical protein
MMTITDIDEKLNDFYEDRIPAYVKGAGKSYITIMTGNDWEGDPFPLKITIKDVIAYYYKDARNISSGIRTLAGFNSDWRGIDALASECLAWFKLVNREALAREGKKYGMELTS